MMLSLNILALNNLKIIKILAFVSRNVLFFIRYAETCTPFFLAASIHHLHLVLVLILNYLHWKQAIQKIKMGTEL